LFDSEADAFLGHFPTLESELSTLISQINLTQGEINTSEQNAEQAVSDAQAKVVLCQDEVDNCQAKVVLCQDEVDNCQYQVALAALQVGLAEDQVDLAENAVEAAENASNATLYDTGKTGGYAVGDVVYSPSGPSYRCIQDQAEGAVQALSEVLYWYGLGGGGSTQYATILKYS